jgi:hypothetical protein
MINKETGYGSDWLLVDYVANEHYTEPVQLVIRLTK